MKFKKAYLLFLFGLSLIALLVGLVFLFIDKQLSFICFFIWFILVCIGGQWVRIWKL